MKVDTRMIIVGAVLLVLFALISRYAVIHQKDPAQETPGSWSCTADTQTCSDGSVVGRVPPYCLFAACPR